MILPTQWPLLCIIYTQLHVIGLLQVSGRNNTQLITNAKCFVLFCLNNVKMWWEILKYKLDKIIPKTFNICFIDNYNISVIMYMMGPANIWNYHASN